MRAEHLQSLEAFDSFLLGFERGTLDKGEWTHAAHVAAAASYLYDSPSFAVTPVLPRMRERISFFNLSVGGANTPTSGYHETLTHFWLLVVARHLHEKQPPSRIEAVRVAVSSFGEQRTLHNLYYSGDVVKDSAARQAWRAPDLQPLQENAS